MSPSNPKRTSRTNTPRPRKIAGAPPASQRGPEDPAAEPLVEPPAAEESPTAKVEKSPAAPAAVEEAGDGRSETEADAARSGPPGFLASPRVTRVLIGVLAVLTVVLVLQLVWLVRHQMVDPPEPAKAAEGSEERVAVEDGRPVVPTELSVQEGVDAAAEAAQLVSGRTWQSYDEEVEAAAALMTPTFEEKFRETAADVKEQYVARKTETDARVVAQGVVRASATELEALVFINQYVTRGEGEDASTTYTPYRALLTLVHTDEGWLVDNIETE